MAESIGDLYAEKPEYFNNLLLGFNFQEGRFQTTEEKNEIQKEYFYYDEDRKVTPPLRLQDIKTGETVLEEHHNNLPILV
jgi:hypothetical protein